ncbi:MAG TPA: ribonuclease HII [Anaerolineae bacterium]|nr:ribonuclease HII [Anaerolineae bacterium]
MAPVIDPDPYPDLRFERRLLKAGSQCIAGLDEAGRGAWAGPVVAAAVVLPLETKKLTQHLHGVRDSKQMTPSQRERCFERIRNRSLSIGIGRTSALELDGLGVIAATRLAMQRALIDLDLIPDHLLIDYLLLPSVQLPQTALAYGDSKSLSIAAASVMAKVTRDRTMVAMEETHPGYGFAAHKGYGTPQHRRSLSILGPCKHHRRSFSPVAALSFARQTKS